jgi:urease accessory protein
VGSDLPSDIERTLEGAMKNCEITTSGATRMGNIIICRILANEAWACHDAIFRCWSVLRPHIAGKPARPIRKC